MIGQFFKKFLSYLLPDEESNISFLNWLFRLFLLLAVLLFAVYVLVNTVKNTEVGKNYGLISALTESYDGNNDFSLNQYIRFNRNSWLALKELRDKYDNFYFGYIIKFYDSYSDNFVTGLDNEDAEILLWIEPKDGIINDFSGLEEIIKRRATELKTDIKSEDGCVEFSIPQSLYPFLRSTFTNFRINEEILEVLVCPIYKNSSNEIFAMTAMYYIKINNYESLKAAFKSITRNIELNLQPYM